MSLHIKKNFFSEHTLNISFNIYYHTKLRVLVLVYSHSFGTWKVLYCITAQHSTVWYYAQYSVVVQSGYAYYSSNKV